VRLRLMHIDFFHNSQFKLSHGLSQLAAKPSRCAARNPQCGRGWRERLAPDGREAGPLFGSSFRLQAGSSDRLNSGRLPQGGTTNQDS
jgi:hypothetical protein